MLSGLSLPLSRAVTTTVLPLLGVWIWFVLYIAFTATKMILVVYCALQQIMGGVEDLQQNRCLGACRSAQPGSGEFHTHRNSNRTSNSTYSTAPSSLRSGFLLVDMGANRRTAQTPGFSDTQLAVVATHAKFPPVFPHSRTRSHTRAHTETIPLRAILLAHTRSLLLARSLARTHTHASRHCELTHVTAASTMTVSERSDSSTTDDCSVAACEAGTASHLIALASPVCTHPHTPVPDLRRFVVRERTNAQGAKTVRPMRA